MLDSDNVQEKYSQKYSQATVPTIDRNPEPQFSLEVRRAHRRDLNGRPGASQRRLHRVPGRTIAGRPAMNGVAAQFAADLQLAPVGQAPRLVGVYAQSQKIYVEQGLIPIPAGRVLLAGHDAPPSP
jgi:hypothetical protein